MKVLDKKNNKVLTKKNKSNKLVIINPLTIKADLKSNKGDLIKKLLLRPINFSFNKTKVKTPEVVLNTPKANLERIKLKFIKESLRKFKTKTSKFVGQKVRKYTPKKNTLKKLKVKSKYKNTKKSTFKKLKVKVKNKNTKLNVFKKLSIKAKGKNNIYRFKRRVSNFKIPGFIKSFVLDLQDKNKRLGYRSSSSIQKSLMPRSTKLKTRKKKRINKFFKKNKVGKQLGFNKKKFIKKGFKRGPQKYIIKNVSFLNNAKFSTRFSPKLSLKVYSPKSTIKDNGLLTSLKLDRINRAKKFKNNCRKYLTLAPIYCRNYKFLLDFNFANKSGALFSKTLLSNFYKKVISPSLK